jgi:hypothetical protein
LSNVEYRICRRYDDRILSKLYFSAYTLNLKDKLQFFDLDLSNLVKFADETTRAIRAQYFGEEINADSVVLFNQRPGHIGAFCGVGSDRSGFTRRAHRDCGSGRCAEQCR